VIVDDFDLMGMSFSPDKAIPPLIIDADRVLTSSISNQCFKPVVGRHSQITESHGIIDQTQLSQCDGLDVRWQASAAAALPDRRSLRITKADDHDFV
jgi:hypothetical protein